ncbi:VanZ family protein [Paenibacillus sp. SI8]|uniref:VanZ family protein n=1 Tax=unclassified Paenibacillus TaxID=185978 RepID=UPI00346681F2
MSQKSGIQKFVWIILPILIWFGVIYGLSSQTHQKQDLRPWIKKEISDRTIKEHFSGTSFYYGDQKISLQTSSASSFLEFFIRKLAHLLVYSILGILIIRLFVVLTRWNLLYIFALTVLICSAYAITDEFHQSFVTGRTSMPIDVLLDTIGAVLGALVYSLISLIVKMFRAKKYKTP